MSSRRNIALALAMAGTALIPLMMAALRLQDPILGVAADTVAGLVGGIAIGLPLTGILYARSGRA